MLDNGYVYPIDARLHAFRDDDRWAMVIETVGYMPRSATVDCALHVFGNCIGEPGEANDELLCRYAEVTEPDEGLPEMVERLRAEGASDLFATDDELRTRVPRDLDELLRLDEWHHPDLAGDELPSATQTFRQLADALVSGDASRYRPDEPPNTHWSNWPEGGTL